MKARIKHIFCTLVATFAIVFSATGLASCGMINDDLPECRQGVELRFVYDYNLEFANAFPSQVDCLILLVYDSEGRYVTTRTESSEILKDENYRMTLDLEPGKYTFVAYGGMECRQSSFHFLQTPGADVSLAQNRVELNANTLTQPKGTELHPLFYGRLDLDVPDRWESYTQATLKMMKDTNNLRVVLQQPDGEPLDESCFDFTLTDDNTLMAWNNDVIPTRPTVFWPWTTGNDAVGEIPDDKTENARPAQTRATEASVCFAEFSFPRLVTSNSPRLLVKQKEDGRVIIDIPLINYLLLAKSASLKGEDGKPMGNQEFLDRESHWTLFFLLDRNMHWYEVAIQVKDWTVRINNVEQ